MRDTTYDHTYMYLLTLFVEIVVTPEVKLRNLSADNRQRLVRWEQSREVYKEQQQRQEARKR